MKIADCQIVLVETSHPGNIGAAARAMKNMGLHKLALVEPCEHQVYDCYARASGAEDIVDNAMVCDDLKSAISESTLVVGTSARLRSLAWPQLSPRECAPMMAEHTQRGPVSIVFGRERSGLTNDELALCSVLLNIPTADNFSSLNVAAAVQVVAYELLCASREQPVPAQDAEVPAEQVALEQFYEHFFSVLEDVGYFDPANPRHLPLRVRRLFNRAHLSVSELQVLRGFLSAVQKSLPG